MPQLAKREARLAVNLLDADRIDPNIRGMLLGGRLDLSAPIRVDPDRGDEIAVAFACDDLTAATIIDIVRAHDRRAGDHPTRAYIKRTKWSKIPGDAVLSLVDADGGVSLNPKVFVVEPQLADPVPPPKRRLTL